MTVYKCKCGAEITRAEHDEQVGLCQDCYEDALIKKTKPLAEWCGSCCTASADCVHCLRETINGLALALSEPSRYRKRDD